MSLLPIAAISGTFGQVLSRVCGEADAEGALDGFWPTRTMTEREPSPVPAGQAVTDSGLLRPDAPLSAPADRRWPRRSGSASGSASGSEGEGRRSGGASNAASLNLADSCQLVLVTFSSRASWCPLNVAELL